MSPKTIKFVDKYPLAVDKHTRLGITFNILPSFYV